MTTNRHQPLPKVEVIKPLTILGIKWRFDQEEDRNNAVAIRFDYSFRDAEGNTYMSSPGLAIDATSNVPEGLLEAFLASGAPSDTAETLHQMGDEPDQPPTVLETGTLAKLLQHGITPEELWVFLLNHGLETHSATIVHDPYTSKRSFIRYFESLSPRLKTWRLKSAIRSCRQAARSLTKVQYINQTDQLGAASPPLAPKRTAELIEDLNLAAEHVKKYMEESRRIPSRPTDPLLAGACRDWYHLAINKAGNPLYSEGAAIYALLSGGKPNPASFKRLCKRARKGGQKSERSDRL
jgi:hypothetical protein